METSRHDPKLAQTACSMAWYAHFIKWIPNAANYFHAGQACGEDFVMQPDLVATPRYAAMTAGWFWDTRKLNTYADEQNIVGMTKRVNGGTNGLDDRQMRYSKLIDYFNSKWDELKLTGLFDKNGAN